MGSARALAGAIALALASRAGPAGAADAGEIAGKPVSVDVTNTAVLAYHFDNRNTKIGDPTTRVDDNYGEYLDRLNVQLGWWRFRLGLRIDDASYFRVPAGQRLIELAQEDANDFVRTHGGADPGPQYERANNFYRELNTRYVQALYPAKLWINYTQPGIDVTVGDFYAQLGRGLVFSVRKIDELAIDTTVRGGKIAVDHDFGDYHFAAMGFAGQLNPLRVDEASGRRLNGGSTPLFFGFPRAPDFQYWTEDQKGLPINNVDPGRPNYLEDTVYGGHVEFGPSFVKLGANVSVLARKSSAAENLFCSKQCAVNDTRCQSDCAARFPNFSQSDASRLHDTIRTFGGSLSFPSIAKTADAYVEVAGQQLRDGHVSDVDGAGRPTVREGDISGYAVYANVSVHRGPATVSFEGKHYRSFFPLSANVDLVTPAFRAPEFSIITYNQVPTAEPIYVEAIGSPNVCMTGGRVSGDYRFSKRSQIHGWIGRYTSFTEIDPSNNLCDRVDLGGGESRPMTGAEVASKQTNTWDTGIGTELVFDNGKSHAYTWMGARVADAVTPFGVAGSRELTTTFYREGYIRYDFVKQISGPFSIQLQGFHRHRYQPQEYGEPWNEGENYTALQWSPHLAAIFGYEYLGKAGCQPHLDPAAPDVKLCHYFNGGLQWRSAQHASVWNQIFDTVSVFVGQRRGAIRCVSGVCRQFPPFEGARIELVSRF